MKRVMLIVVTLSTVMLFYGQVSATWLKFSFDPNALIDNYGTDFTTGLKATQTDPRRIHNTWGSDYYGTFSNYVDPDHVQPNDGNTYANWRAGLGPGEGISRFNIWLRGGIAARSWGETLVTRSSSNSSDIFSTATGADGWTASIIADPWSTNGWLVEWSTTDSAKYIRPGGANIGTFSFAADLYVDANDSPYPSWDITDPGAEAGEFRIWFGNYNQDYGDYSLHFDANGWGSDSPAYSAFAASGDSGWEGVLGLQGNPVPEPSTMLLLGSGLVGIYALGRKRFKK